MVPTFQYAADQGRGRGSVLDRTEEILGDLRQPDHVNAGRQVTSGYLGAAQPARLPQQATVNWAPGASCSEDGRPGKGSQMTAQSFREVFQLAPVAGQRSVDGQDAVGQEADLMLVGCSHSPARTNRLPQSPPGHHCRGVGRRSLSDPRYGGCLSRRHEDVSRGNGGAVAVWPGGRAVG